MVHFSWCAPQTAVDDVKWMKAMIPHHSIAILTSTNAAIKDPEVKELADDIIQTQKEEIEKMKRNDRTTRKMKQKPDLDVLAQEVGFFIVVHSNQKKRC